jgi:hypothetical protein
MGKQERANKALATSIFIDHSMWKEAGSYQGMTIRICSAEGCNHEFPTLGAVPTGLDRLSHQIDKLFEAGFGLHEEPEIQFEYGATFRENGKDSVSFPSFWTTNIKEAKEDLDWHVNKDKTAFPDRKWRIVKRYPSVIVELDEGEEAQIDE